MNSTTTQNPLSKCDKRAIRDIHHPMIDAWMLVTVTPDGVKPPVTP